LELALETLVLRQGLLGGGLEGGELGFEVFYVALFALAEGALARLGC
jgi:hypothetical protein